VLNIVHGTHDTVNRILDHPDIAAVSFVGGDKAGRYIYERAAANGKRVQVRAAAAAAAARQAAGSFLHHAQGRHTVCYTSRTGEPTRTSAREG
jgi:acyl-CoA reductase-like NAD-dependent aldehyde dehydrogenase